MKKFDWQYVKDRLAEASTIRGIICLLVLVFGWQMSPDQIDSVVPVAALVVDAILKIALPDGAKDKQ